VHDLAAVTTLVDRLGSGAVPAERIAEIRIRAGPEFDPEALEQAYEMCVRGTPLAGSRLVIEPTLALCAVCGVSGPVGPEDLAGHVLLCPACGAPSPVEHGMGIELVGMDLRPGPSAPPC